MTVFGAHAFVWSAEWDPDGAERALRGAAARGLDFVEIPLLRDLQTFPLQLTRDLLAQTGLVLERGRLGVWLVGEAGAVLVRSGGRRVFCFCVRTAEHDLPWADRIAHLLLALRSDEPGFATVANLAFSGARWRLRRRLPSRVRPALDAAARIAAGA